LSDPKLRAYSAYNLACFYSRTGRLDEDPVPSPRELRGEAGADCARARTPISTRSATIRSWFGCSLP